MQRKKIRLKIQVNIIQILDLRIKIESILRLNINFMRLKRFSGLTLMFYKYIIVMIIDHHKPCKQFKSIIVNLGLVIQQVSPIT